MYDYECEGNMTIFDFMYPRFKIDNPIRLIELFGGVGSQAMALRNIGADFEHYKLVEYDKYPVMSYNAIHGTDFKPTDIRNVHGNDLRIVDTDKYTYIMTYSFPCQDLSVAGKMKGMSKGSGTRSGLLWEVERQLNETDNLPQVLLMENVPQVISDQNIADFHLWQEFLESKGYTNYVEVLNAKDYRVAQNRERCFMISLLGQWNYKFPQSIPLTKTMADYLEDEVDEKYYINSDKAMNLIQQLVESGQLLKGNCVDASYMGIEEKARVYDTIYPTLTARDYKEPRMVVDTIKVGQISTDGSQCGTVYLDDGLSPTLTAGTHGYANSHIAVKQEGNYETGRSWDNPQTGRVYSPDGISPTLNTCGGGDREPKIIEPVIVASRGRNPQDTSDRTPGAPTEQRLEPNSEGICNTLTSVQKDNLVLEPRLVGGIGEKDWGSQWRQGNRVYDSNAVAMCLNAQPVGNAGGNSYLYMVEDKVKIKQSTKEGYIECKLGGVADLSYPESKTRRGRVQDNGDTCPTLTATETGVCRIETPYRIRKLTPMECWRLMGFSDEDFHKAEKVNSNTQLYKQAGNSIVVNVLEAIFKQLM